MPVGPWATARYRSWIITALVKEGVGRYPSTRVGRSPARVYSFWSVIKRTYAPNLVEMNWPLLICPSYFRSQSPPSAPRSPLGLGYRARMVAFWKATYILSLAMMASTTA